VNDRETIERLRDEFVVAFNHEDTAAMGQYATADTVSMAPNRAAIRGLDAQRTVWNQGFAAAKSLLFLFPGELELLGDVAIDRHRWVLDSMPKRGGRPVHDEGKAIWIWRRQTDGSWKVARSIWNSDLSRAAFVPGLGDEISDELAAINRLLDAFVGTVNAGDADAWGAIMIDDFIFSVPDAPRFIGREVAVAAAKAAFFDPFTLRLASRFEDVQIFGNQAFAHGVFIMDMMPKAGGDMITAPGKFTNFFRKEGDGSWRFQLVNFSYDQPTA
jgi:uncharacterized protein (TIGR02246 family)